MRARLRPRIKVCCIADITEAWLAIDAGASALGLVSAMPSGPGVISDEVAAEIASAVPPGVDTVLLTSRCDAAGIIEQHEAIHSTTLQLVDHVEFAELRVLREELPGIRVVQVLHVRGDEALDEAAAVAPLVDAVLLDSGNPGALVKTLGGTGQRHDWEVSRRIRELLDVPVSLPADSTPATSGGRCGSSVRTESTCAAGYGPMARSIPNYWMPSSPQCDCGAANIVLVLHRTRRRLSRFRHKLRSPRRHAARGVAVFGQKDPEQLAGLLGRCERLHEWATERGVQLTDDETGLVTLEERLDEWKLDRKVAPGLATETALYLGSVIVPAVPSAHWATLSNGQPVVRLESGQQLDVIAIVGKRLRDGGPSLPEVLAGARA